MPTTSGHPLMSNPLLCSENENREPAHFQRLLRHRSVPASFLRQILTLPLRTFTPSAPAAPRSAAPCFRTTAASDDSPPVAASSTGRASPACHRSSPTV